MRYRPDGPDFVIDNGQEFFNRPLYGGNSAFRVDGGDRPEFSLYLPGRGGNLRLGVRTANGTVWLHSAESIQTRYRPGELHYLIADKVLGTPGRIHLNAVAYAVTEGLAVQVRPQGLPKDAELLIAFAPGNGERGKRDGDIGTERVPIGEYFQFQPGYAQGSRIELHDHGFRAVGKHAVITATVSAPALVSRVNPASWHDLGASEPGTPGEPSVAVIRVKLAGEPIQLSLQVTAKAEAGVLDVYREAGAGDKTAGAVGSQRLPAFTPAELWHRFTEANGHFGLLRYRVRIVTPDPYLDAAMGALNVAADAVWDEEKSAIMHGAIAWRTKLLGWRGPYALDALGWHDRARRNFDGWTARQNTDPVPAHQPPADASSNLARSEAALHSNGDMSKSHYDMNLVFIDALLRHLLWTGDVAFAKTMWPVLERHLAWERRMFRREFGPERLPLYEAYAAIWASDDLYYNGGGATHASAYNAWHNEIAARIARLIGEDPAMYEAEASAIKRAMRAQLWMPERGAFGEYRDLLGRQLLHPSYGLWTFYHTIDSQIPTPLEAARMAADLDRHLRPLPIQGAGVPDDAPYRMLPSSNWMPYTWSINNVVMGENLHTALAYWQAGRRQTAFELAKGSLMASMYMGITPGNVGSMNFLDVYRRESQRDFADGSGVMSRTLIEGLFGFQPDALAGVLTVRPGFPAHWSHALMDHPDVSLDFQRKGLKERWSIGQRDKRFRRLVIDLPALRERVARLRLNGKRVPWKVVENAVGEPRLRMEAPFGARARIEIKWAGKPVGQGNARVTDVAGSPDTRRYRQGAFSWLQLAPRADPVPAECKITGAAWTTGPFIESKHLDLTPWFNERVTEIFKKGKYLAPRSSGTSLSLPSQGIGAWAGHVNEMALIDDTGLQASGGAITLPNGLSFKTGAQAATANVIFTSQWNNYPRDVTVPVAGQARRAFLLVAGSTNAMQSRIDNGEIEVVYEDGSTTRIALRNPETWCDFSTVPSKGRAARVLMAVPLPSLNCRSIPAVRCEA